METVDTVVKNAYIVTLDHTKRVFTNGYIAVSKGRIVGVGPSEENAYEGLETIDACQRIVLPGFVNAHNHLVQVGLRGYNDERWPMIGDLFSAVRKLTEVLFRLASRLDGERGRAIGRLHLLELMRAGYTTTHDEHFTNECRDLADGVWSALQESGLRGFVARCVVDGPLVPEAAKESVDEGLSEVERLHHQFSSELIRVVPSFMNYGWRPNTSEIVEIGAAAIALGVPLDIDMTDNSPGRLRERGFEGGQVEYYESLGLLGAPTYAGKGVGVRPDEVELLSDRDCRLALVPMLRLIDGVGLPIHWYLSHGMTPGLGTDAPLVSDSQSPWLLMRDAMLAQNLAVRREVEDGRDLPVDSEWARAETVLEMVTLGGARALFQEKDAGALEVGKSADFIIVDGHDAFLAPAYETRRLIANLVWAGTRSAVKSVFVAGRKLVEDGRSVVWDEERVIREAEEALMAAAREAGVDEALPERIPGASHRSWEYH